MQCKYGLCMLTAYINVGWLFDVVLFCDHADWPHASHNGMSSTMT